MTAEQFQVEIEKFNTLLEDLPLLAVSAHKRLTHDYARLSVADAEECLLPFMRATNNLEAAGVVDLRDLQIASPECPSAEQLRSLLIGTRNRGLTRFPHGLGRLKSCVEMVRAEGLRDRVDALAKDVSADLKWRALARRWARVEEVVDALDQIGAEWVCADAWLDAKTA